MRWCTSQIWNLLDSIMESRDHLVYPKSTKEEGHPFSWSQTIVLHRLFYAENNIKKLKQSTCLFYINHKVYYQQYSKCQLFNIFRVCFSFSQADRRVDHNYDSLTVALVTNTQDTYIPTFIFSASLLAISDEFWYLIIGHFFNESNTANIPWHARSIASISHAPAWNSILF